MNNSDVHITLALYEPDIPQNVGAAMRLTACLGMPLHIIEPCGFPWNTKKIKQSGMDYMTLVNYERFDSWQDYRNHTNENKRRIILMTTKTDMPYTSFKFHKNDVLLAGRESAGVPDIVSGQVDGCVAIPMHKDARSLNVINASAMILGEALRQVNT